MIVILSFAINPFAGSTSESCNRVQHSKGLVLHWLAGICELATIADVKSDANTRAHILPEDAR